MREIVLDTETTGLDPREGHRMVELAALELVERVATGRSLHLYFHPDRPMPPEAERVHGLTDAFLADKPRFAEVQAEIVAFLADSPIVAHNANFDWRFLNCELEAAGQPAIAWDRMIDTMELARKRLPGAKHSLDALCQRFGIDLSRRVRHGALIDTELLAAVYIELTGGRQMGLDLAGAAAAREGKITAGRPARPPRHFAVPQEELERHRAFVQAMRDPLWLRVAKA
jgi:DNA polymerase-3 subunit epsilon